MHLPVVTSSYISRVNLHLGKRNILQALGRQIQAVFHLEQEITHLLQGASPLEQETTRPDQTFLLARETTLLEQDNTPRDLVRVNIPREQDRKTIPLLLSSTTSSGM